MSEFTKSVEKIRSRYNRKLELESIINNLKYDIETENEEYCNMLEALEYIGALSDRNTNKILDFITGVINNALSKIFPYDKRSIRLDRTLYRNEYTHINIKLITGDGKERDLATQSGTGLRQIISFLFSLTLIEVRKERRIFVMDELLSGLHATAKKIMSDIIEIFAKDGFQFIAVEYGLNDIGKIYLVEKPDSIAICSEYQGTYTDDVIFSEMSEEKFDIGGQFIPTIKQ